MPVYQYQDRWLIRISHKGRKLSWIVEGKKKDALRLEAQKRLELSVRDPGVRKTGMTFFALCAEYEVHAKLHLSPSWRTKQQYMIASLVEYFGDWKLADIDGAAIDRYIVYRQEQSAKKRSKLRASTLNNECRVLRTILRFAAKKRGQIIAESLGEPLKERGDKRVKFWTQAELQKLFTSCIGACADPHIPQSFAAMVIFLANTGCRKGEALALTWDNVDLDRGYIHIWPTEEWQPKNNKPREIPISSALRPWLLKQSDNREYSRWVFPHSRRDSEDRAQRYVVWPQKIFEAAVKSAGLGGGPHKLRHTFAAAFLAAGGKVFTLSQILGHSHERTTALYSHLAPEHLAEARDLVSFAPTTGPAQLDAARRWSEKGM